MYAKAVGAILIASLIQVAPALAADPLKIGVLMPTSGVFAVLGQRQLNGMRFAIEEAGGEVAGRKIEMLHEDSEGKPDVGLAKARKLVLSDRIDVMAGIINSAVALAVAPYLSSQRIPLVISNASTDVLSGEKCDRYVFRVSYSSSQITEPIGLWMAKHAPKNLYILASGMLKVTQKGKLLNAVSAGECVGEMAYARRDGNIRSATVTAVQPSWAIRMRVQDIDSLSEGCRARFIEAFLAIMADRLAMLGNRLVARV